MHPSPRLRCDLAAGAAQWDHCAAWPGLFGSLSPGVAEPALGSFPLLLLLVLRELPVPGKLRQLMQKAACKRQTPCQQLSKDLPSSAQVSIPRCRERYKVKPSDRYATGEYYSTIGD
ncbi:unnamed protein product [Coccothraustes coccothraustes]